MNQEPCCPLPVDGHPASANHRVGIHAHLDQNEEFHRLISENVSDLIAVLDHTGRRLYNNPAYERSLGRTGALEGTDSFHEIHPDDRDRIRRIFDETISSGIGQRAEYRMRLADGSIRHIESLGSVIRDEQGQPRKVVVVSRDITERRQAMNELERTVRELCQAHQALQSAQEQVVQSEKLEAISTFAAAIAHEVRNPLQTLLLGVDFLRQIHESANGVDSTIATVLTDLENGARRANAVIEGLLELTSYRGQDVTDQDLSVLIQRALQTIESELTQRAVHLTTDLADRLPAIRVDGRKIRHVLIKLFLGSIERSNSGGTLSVRTYSRPGTTRLCADSAASPGLRLAEDTVLAEIELRSAAPHGARTKNKTDTALIRQEELDLLVMKKVIGLYGGVIHILTDSARVPGNARIVLQFRARPQHPA